MSRFVRASKYRHVFGQNGKKEYGFDNVKVTNSAWDTNVISASTRYVSLNWNSSGGGAFAILPLPSPFAPLPSAFPSKLPDLIPLARSHSGPVLDTDWSPFNDSIVASAGEDGKVMIWKVESGAFEGWGEDGWEPRDFDPVARLDVSPRRVGHVLFHPTANNVLATSTGDHVVKLWDLANPESAKSVLGGHGDAIQSITFNPWGTVLVTTCRDRKIRLFDPRAGGDPVRVGEGHSGIKGARVVWMGDKDRLATTGFSKMSDRQVALWETGGLGNVKTITIDQTSGVLMPFWTDNNILFLAGKGDGNIRYYEYESDNLFPLAEYKSSEPQRGMCFLPRRGLSVSDCEIARALKVAANSIEAIAFIVPRKSDSFQSDIYPPAPSAEPALTAAEFFSGKNAPPKLVSLEDGSISSVTGSAPIATPAPAPTRTTSAPPPAAAPATPAIVVRDEPSPAPSPVAAPPRIEPTRSQSLSQDNSEVSSLREENARLTSELREARAQIRNLELQVETVRANARKAAALLDS
ncbi:microtubule binding protein [Dichomitus squalens]|uniref:Coronin n=2 Tax=Dichomitus squalens TaxID=114155 RepID=A0A4V2K362_9APHY|nr:microtubule binding protein [Dichomitus squalens LYAD-421 SS1]EJF58048.1 microtubule binding protein [Dichomitus squalens LYAD-421 SS1]TBU39323.1 microtubule binding protein [Dichomitus squalens]TBU53232.1 microtubule binding protein [Dichomitus squalens]